MKDEPNNIKIIQNEQTKNTEKIQKNSGGLLEKIKRKKQKIALSEEQIKRPLIKEGEMTDERSGFGWKGLGSRIIKFDDNVKENIYKIKEPILSNEAEIIKNDIINCLKTITKLMFMGQKLKIGLNGLKSRLIK